MREDIAARLLEVVQDLDRDVEVTAACGLGVTTKLLRMARLDLLCLIHDISEGELQTIGDELQRKQPVSSHTGPNGSHIH
jgi:hypothetical protein